MKGELRPVKDLHVLPDNPRHGDIGAISESLRRFGQQKPIVVNTDGVILAGNHTYQAAVSLGWETIWAVTSTLEGKEQTGFALADNRLSDLATYDHDVLIAQLQELDTLDGTGFDDDDLADLIQDAQRRPIGVQGSPAPPQTDIRPGDEIVLGEHLLICGDATDPAYARPHKLMFADPPYNVGVAYGSMTNDDRADYEEWTASWWDAMGSERAVMTFGWVGLGMAYRLFDIRHVGVWIKRNGSSPSPISMFSYWEPIVFVGSHFKDEPMRSDDLFAHNVTPTSGGGDHPVPKPVSLLVDLIENFTRPGDTVFDPFAGSGTTLIAAQQTGRRAVLVEIEPGYCQGIVERWNDHISTV